MLSFFLVANIPLIIFPNKQRANNPLETMATIGVAFLAGLLSSLVGAIGVLFNRFYSGQGIAKESVIATRAVNEIAILVLKLISCRYLDLRTLQVAKMGAVIAITAFFATIVSKPLLYKVSGTLFLLHSATISVMTTNHPSLKVEHIANGIDTTFRWNAMLYSIEYRYTEGSEFEQLPSVVREKYQTLQDNYLVTVEKIYSVDGIGYEIYCLDRNRHLVKKITSAP